jgi:hypothetical protein
MAKLIISERQFNLIKEHLSEEIDPSEAYRDKDSIDTVLSGSRNVAFLVVYLKEHAELLEKAKEAGLKVITMPQDLGSFGKSTANIVYRPNHEKEAMRLATIARKNGGYLPTNTPEETYEIGILLGYYPEKVKEFVLKKFPSFRF